MSPGRRRQFWKAANGTDAQVDSRSHIPARAQIFPEQFRRCVGEATAQTVRRYRWSLTEGYSRTSQMLRQWPCRRSVPSSAIVSSIEPRELPSRGKCCEVGTHACSCPLACGNFQRLMPREGQRERGADAGVPLSHTSFHSIDARCSTGVPGCIESEPEPRLEGVTGMSLNGHDRPLRANRRSCVVAIVRGEEPHAGITVEDPIIHTVRDAGLRFERPSV